MIFRTILFGAILYFFIWDYRQNKKNYKFLVFPLIVLTYLGTTEIFIGLDDRFQMTLIIIAFIITLRYAWSYYKDFKLERFRFKKRERDLRKEERELRDKDLIDQIYMAKEEALKHQEVDEDIDKEADRKDIEPSGRVSEINLEVKSDIIRD